MKVFPWRLIFTSRVIVSRAIIKNIPGKEQWKAEEAEVHSFQSPSEYSLKREMMASIVGINWQGDVLLIPRWHTMNVSTLSRPRGFSSKRLPPRRCDRACRVCTGCLINIGRISERARKAKRFFFSLPCHAFSSLAEERSNRRESKY